MPIFRLVPLRLHALFDALFIVVALAAPWLLGYAGSGLAAYYTWGAGGAALVLNLTTDYPLGVIKLIPPRVHSLVEWVAPAPFIVGPLVLFPGTAAAWVVVSLGVFNFIYNALTDWPIRRR